MHGGHHKADAKGHKKKKEEEDLSNAKPGDVHVSAITGKVVKSVHPPAAAFEVGPGRRQHARERMRRANIDEAEAQETIAMFAKNGENTVSGQELLDLIDFCGDGAAIDAGEIEWIMAIADNNHDHKIGIGEYGHLKSALQGYLAARERIRSYLEDFDVNNDAKFQKDELTNLLTMLNDGIRVPDGEVDWVMRNTGNRDYHSLAIPEVEAAINLWYNHADRPKPSKPADRKKGGAVGHAVTGINDTLHSDMNKDEMYQRVFEENPEKKSKKKKEKEHDATHQAKIYVPGQPPPTHLK